jgi:hypothetical protein
MGKKKKGNKEIDLTNIVNYVGKLKDDLNELEGLISTNMKILKEKLFDVTNWEVVTDNYKAKIIQRNSITYDAYEVEKKVDKQIVKEVIIKNYVITDTKGFAKLMKEHGISYKKAKEFMYVDKKVDKSRLEELAKEGIIEAKDLEGCYSVSQSEYVKISKIRKKG